MLSERLKNSLSTRIEFLSDAEIGDSTSRCRAVTDVVVIDRFLEVGSSGREDVKVGTLRPGWDGLILYDAVSLRPC